VHLEQKIEVRRRGVVEVVVADGVRDDGAVD
jgi:hypothetical protein